MRSFFGYGTHDAYSVRVGSRRIASLWTNTDGIGDPRSYTNEKEWSSHRVDVSAAALAHRTNEGRKESTNAKNRFDLVRFDGVGYRTVPYFCLTASNQLFATVSESNRIRHNR